MFINLPLKKVAIQCIVVIKVEAWRANLEKPDTVLMESWWYCINLFPRSLYLILQIQFRADWESAKFDRIAPLGSIRFCGPSAYVLQENHAAFDKKEFIKNSLGVTCK